MLQNTVKMSCEILCVHKLFKEIQRKVSQRFIWKKKLNECFSHLRDYRGTAYFLSNYNALLLFFFTIYLLPENTI